MHVNSINKNTVVSFIWCFPALLEAIGALARAVGLGIISGLLSIFLYFAYIIFIFISLRRSDKQITVYEIVFVWIMLSSILFTFLFFPKNSSVLEKALSGCIYYPFLYLGGRICITENTGIKNMANASRAGIILGWLAYFIKLQGISNDMSFAYLILPYVIVCIAEYFQERKKPDLLFLIFGIVLLFLLGTRGPLLAVLVFTALLIAKKTKRKSIIILIIIAAIGLKAFYESKLFYQLVVLIDGFLKSKGINSYIFSNIIQHSTASMDLRAMYRTQLLAEVWQSPLQVRGVCADRVVLGTYAHNILIELLYEFGIVGATILVCLFIYLIFIAIKCQNSDEQKLLIVAILFGYFFKFFFSSSYISDQGFFFLIGGLNGFIVNPHVQTSTA